MICLKTFTHKTIENFNSFEEWVDFVNTNEKYANEKSLIFDWIGKCNDYNLPSFHPYWNYITEKQLVNYTKKLIEKYNCCLEDFGLIKYYFNGSTSLIDIEEKIKLSLSKITNPYLSALFSTYPASNQF